MAVVKSKEGADAVAPEFVVLAAAVKEEDKDGDANAVDAPGAADAEAACPS